MAFSNVVGLFQAYLSVCCLRVLRLFSNLPEKLLDMLLTFYNFFNFIVSQYLCLVVLPTGRLLSVALAGRGLEVHYIVPLLF